MRSISLETLRVETPCTVAWDSMRGDAQVRYCGECRHNVYDISALTRAEAEALIAGHEGRLCVRFFERADGTIVTRDCARPAVRAVRPARWASPILVALGFAALAGMGRPVEAHFSDLLDLVKIPDVPPSVPGVPMREVMGMKK